MEQRPHVNPTFSSVKSEPSAEPLQPTLFGKLAGIMKDPDLAVEIGGIIDQLTLPSLVQRGRITELQQGELKVTLNGTLESLLTPEQIQVAEREASASLKEVSDFVTIRNY